MKKILGIIGAVGLTVPTTLSVVSCINRDDDLYDPGDDGKYLDPSREEEYSLEELYQEKVAIDDKKKDFESDLAKIKGLGVSETSMTQATYNFLNYQTQAEKVLIYFTKVMVYDYILLDYKIASISKIEEEDAQKVDLVINDQTVAELNKKFYNQHLAYNEFIDKISELNKQTQDKKKLLKLNFWSRLKFQLTYLDYVEWSFDYQMNKTINNEK